MITGSCGCPSPLELCAVGPDAVQNGGHFPGNGDFGFLRTNAFGKLCAPTLQRRSAPDDVEQHVGRLEQVVPGQPIPTFGDAPCAIECFQGGAAARDYAM